MIDVGDGFVRVVLVANGFLGLILYHFAPPTLFSDLLFAHGDELFVQLKRILRLRF